MPIVTRNLLPAVLIVSSVWLFFGVIWPKYGSIQTLEAAESSYKSAIDTANQAKALRERRLADYDSITDLDKARMQRLMPNSVDQIKLALDLSSLAANYTNTVTKIAFDIPIADNQTSANPAGLTTPDANGMPVGPVSFQRYSTLEIIMGLKAKYQDFLNFLKAVESDLELMDVVQIGIGTNSNDNQVSGAKPSSKKTAVEGDTLHDFQVTIHTYWLNNQ